LVIDVVVTQDALDGAGAGMLVVIRVSLNLL